MEETTISAIPTPDMPIDASSFVLQESEETQEDKAPQAEPEPESVSSSEEDTTLEEEFEEVELIIEDFTIDGICGVY